MIIFCLLEFKVVVYCYVYYHFNVNLSTYRSLLMKAASVKILKIHQESTSLHSFLCCAVVPSWLLLQVTETGLYVFLLFIQTTGFNLRLKWFNPWFLKLYDLQLDNILEVYAAFGALQMHSSAVDQIQSFFFNMFWAVFCYWEVLSGMALDVFCNNCNLRAVDLTSWNAEMAGQE